MAPGGDDDDSSDGGHARAHLAGEKQQNKMPTCDRRPGQVKKRSTEAQDLHFTGSEELNAM
jgi:hypothetical protein